MLGAGWLYSILIITGMFVVCAAMELLGIAIMNKEAARLAVGGYPKEQQKAA